MRGAGALEPARRPRQPRSGPVPPVREPGARGARGLPTGTPPGVFTVPFDPNDPVNTPRGLNTDNSTVRAALADSVKELRDQGIPLDARLREYQYEMRGKERIPIHGGPGGLGVFNAISAPFKAREGFPDIVHGSSFVMAAHLNGTRCPDSRSILTYSLSANPDSPSLRRPDPALLAQALGGHALLRRGDPARPPARRARARVRAGLRAAVCARASFAGRARSAGFPPAPARAGEGRGVPGVCRAAQARGRHAPVEVVHPEAPPAARRLRGALHGPGSHGQGRPSRRGVPRARRPRLDREAVDLSPRGLRHDPLRGAALAAVPEPRSAARTGCRAGHGCRWRSCAARRWSDACAPARAPRARAASRCGRFRQAPTPCGSWPGRARAGQWCGSPRGASSRRAISAAPSAIRFSASGCSSGSSRLARRLPSSSSTRGTCA